MGTDQCIFSKPFYGFLKPLETLESLKESKSRLKIILLQKRNKNSQSILREQNL